MDGIFDTHAHYADAAFDGDRDAVLAALRPGGVCAVLEQATGPQDIPAVLAIAARHEGVYAALGVHPEFAAGVTEASLAAIRPLYARPRVVAVGEIGLDYHYEDACPREKQKEVFAAQLAWAAAQDLPVCVHDREAHGDTMELLRTYRPRGVIHCFSGSVEMMRQAVELGLYIGLGGVVTFHNARRAVEVAAAVPADRLLLETDAPYMAPEPERGTRCTSVRLRYVVSKLAEIRGTSEAEIRQMTRRNACRLFKIDEI